MINDKQLGEFSDLLRASSLAANDKRALKFAIEFLEGKHDLRLSSRIFLLTGEPGVGKTHLVESFLNILELPVIFTGCTQIRHKNLIICKNLKEALEQMQKLDRYIIFVDDLSYVFKYSEYDEISASDRQDYMKVVDTIKNSGKRILLFSTANHIHSLDESVLDRIDVKIEMDIPIEETKLAFLNTNYSEFMHQRLIRYLSWHSLGYNFRDLPEVIKIAYRRGEGKINIKNLNKALKDYIPTSLNKYQVINNVRVNFSHIIGKEKIKKELSNIVLSIKKRKLALKLGLKRHNLLLFDGPVGTGKTFMVKALAGELNFPLINIKAKHFFSYSTFRVIDSLGSFAKRFNNCIIFIDEAEKIIGRHSMDEDSPMDGQLNEIFDGIDSITNAIVIVAVNNSLRFGMGVWDRFAMIKFELPNIHERRDFLKAIIGKTKIEADFDEIARMTEGMSFRDLEKLCNNIFYRILKGDSVNSQSFSEAVRNLKAADSGLQMYG